MDESEFAQLQPPYRIVYEIDPWLTDATAPNDNVFESTFNSADALVQVECHVSAGKVLASLAEWDANQNNYVTRNADATTPRRGLFTLQGHKLSGGSWRVSLVKESGSPKFNLAYAKTVN